MDFVNSLMSCKYVTFICVFVEGWNIPLRQNNRLEDPMTLQAETQDLLTS